MKHRPGWAETYKGGSTKNNCRIMKGKQTCNLKTHGNLKMRLWTDAGNFIWKRSLIEKKYKIRGKELNLEWPMVWWKRKKICGHKRKNESQPGLKPADTILDYFYSSLKENFYFENCLLGKTLKQNKSKLPHGRIPTQKKKTYIQFQKKHKIQEYFLALTPKW